MGRAFLQYDVFTGEALLGNQLAVFTDGQGLDTAMMQRIAREMNFSESTFILPAEWICATRLSQSGLCLRARPRGQSHEPDCGAEA